MARDYAKQKPGKRGSNYRGKSKAQTKSSAPLWLLTGILAGLLIAGIFYIQNHVGQQAQTNANNLVLKASQKEKAQSETKIAKADKSQQPQFDFYTILPKMKVWVPSNQQSSVAAAPPQAQAVIPPPFSNNQTTATKPATTTTAPASSTNTAVAAQPTANNANSAAIASNNATTSNSATNNTSPTSANKSSTNTAANTSTANNITAASASVTNNSASSSNKYILQIAALANFKDADTLKAQLTLMGFNVAIKQSDDANKTLNHVEVGPYDSLTDANKAQQALQQQHISSILVKITA